MYIRKECLELTAKAGGKEEAAKCFTFSPRRSEKVAMSRFKGKNNVVIIIDGEDAAEIKKQLLLEVRKMSRRKELGYYVTLAGAVSTEMLQEFANIGL